MLNIEIYRALIPKTGAGTIVSDLDEKTICGFAGEVGVRYACELSQLLLVKVTLRCSFACRRHFIPAYPMRILKTFELQVKLKYAFYATLAAISNSIISFIKTGVKRSRTGLLTFLRNRPIPASLQRFHVVSLCCNRHMKPPTTSIALLLVSLQLIGVAPSRAADGEPFYTQKERGWFWREPEPQLDEEKPAKPAPPLEKVSPPPSPTPTASPPAPVPFSAKWFKENLDKYRELAIDNPTKENVSAYIALQRVMLDKAGNFADVWQEIILRDTDFNESARRPSSSAGAGEMDESASMAKVQLTQAIAERVGIWFFFRSDCASCAVQFTALQGLAERYHFKVMPISLDGRPLKNLPKMSFLRDQGQSTQLGVDILPTTFAVMPPSNYVKLTTWAASTDELIARLIAVSKSTGLVDDEAVASTRAVKNRSVSANFGKNIDPKILEDRQSLTEYIRNEIRAGGRTPTR